MISLTLATAIAGGSLVAGEIASYFIKKSNKSTDKMADAKIEGIKHLENFLGNDGLKISKNIQLNNKSCFEGIMVVAPTGGGKTTGYFYPNLLSKDIKGSIVVIDPKGELYRDTSKYQEEVCKRKVIRFSPLEPQISARYNLLEQCDDTTEVCQLANSLLMNGALSVELATGKKAGGVEWIQMAEPLLAAALLYVKDLGEPYNNVETAFQLILSLKNRELSKVLGQSKNRDVVTQYRIFKSVGGADRTLGSIKITLAANIKLFTDKKINKVCSSTDFTAEEFRKKDTILYITYPERKAIYLSPLIAPFFSQFIDKLLDNFTRKSNPVYFFMDEFANCGMINNMSTHASTVRSRKISLSICVQSISQLQQVYGKNNAQAIMNNLKTKIVLPALNDTDTLNYISSLCGNTEIRTTNISESKGNVTRNTNTTTRKLFNLEDIRILKDDTMLILMHNRQPVIDIQNAYYKSNEYIKNVIETGSKIIYKDLNYKLSGEKIEEFIKSLLIKYHENEEESTNDLSEEIFK